MKKESLEYFRLSKLATTEEKNLNHNKKVKIDRMKPAYFYIFCMNN